MSITILFALIFLNVVYAVASFGAAPGAAVAPYHAAGIAIIAITAKFAKFENQRQEPLSQLDSKRVSERPVRYKP